MKLSILAATLAATVFVALLMQLRPYELKIAEKDRCCGVYGRCLRLHDADCGRNQEESSQTA